MTYMTWIEKGLTYDVRAGWIRCNKDEHNNLDRWCEGSGWWCDMMMTDHGDDDDDNDNLRATYRRFFKSMGKTVSPAQ